jgi:hypothetical protein
MHIGVGMRRFGIVLGEDRSDAAVLVVMSYAAVEMAL